MVVWWWGCGERYCLLFGLHSGSRGAGRPVVVLFVGVKMVAVEVETDK